MNGDISPQLVRMRGWLLRLASAMELPPNPLDHLVSLLGGEAQVAELTGRKSFVAMDADTNKAVFRQRGQDEVREWRLLPMPAFEGLIKQRVLELSASAVVVALTAGCAAHLPAFLCRAAPRRT